MTGGEIAQIIVALATFVTSLGSVMVSLRNSRKIDAVHDSTNSLAERAETTAHDTGRLEGNLEGRREQTEERRVERAG